MHEWEVTPLTGTSQQSPSSPKLVGRNPIHTARARNWFQLRGASSIHFGTDASFRHRLTGAPASQTNTQALAIRSCHHQALVSFHSSTISGFKTPAFRKNTRLAFCQVLWGASLCCLPYRRCALLNSTRF